MSGRRSVSQSLTDFCLRLVDVASLLVPRAGRHDWRSEWHAELWYRSLAKPHPTPADESLRAGRRQPANSPDRELLYRSLGAFRHAAWLRSQEWKPDMLLQDLRYAIRSLRRAPTFTIMALLTLAIGIGANTMVFGMLESVLLRPYPFERAEELVGVFTTDTTNPGVERSMSFPTYLAIRDAGVLDDIAVWDWEPMNLRTADETVFVGVGQVSASLFDVLHVEPLAGRGFLPGEDVPGNGSVAVLSEGVWKSRFAADPGVIGQAISLDGTPRVVVGVVPHEFGYPDEVEIWVPLTVTAETSPASTNWLGAIARLKPGMSIDQARAALTPVATRLEEEFPGPNRNRGLGAKSLREEQVGNIRPFFLVLFGAVGFLMLIVCANVANLLLARASAREREISVRLALGANRTRLVRQLLTESLLLSCGGLALGFALSSWATNAILDFIPIGLRVWLVIETNVADAVFMAAIAFGATLLFGLAPALQTTRPDVSSTLAYSRAAAGVGRRVTRNALVVAEVAICLMLLVGAGLMAVSFIELASVDPGFTLENRLVATMQMPRAKYGTQESRIGFYREMLERLATLPSVERVGAITRIPLGGASNNSRFRYEGQDPEEAVRNPSALNNSVSPGYFEAMGIELLRGRAFAMADGADATPVVIVNAILADYHFPYGDALGKRLSFAGENWMEIVGVVGSVRHHGLEVPGQLQLYRPYEQAAQGRLSLVIETSGDPETLAPLVRAEIRDIDPDQALYNLKTLESSAVESIWMNKLFSQLMWVFALAAGCVAAVGIYGVTAYSVSRRTHELGVRMALGAHRAHIMRMVVRQSMAVVFIGIGIGLAMALAQGAVLEAMLHGVSGTDPTTYAVVTAMVVFVALIAAWLPARRATRLDPVRALRDD